VKSLIIKLLFSRRQRLEHQFSDELDEEDELVDDG
jgi:hypothetical protein